MSVVPLLFVALAREFAGIARGSAAITKCTRRNQASCGTLSQALGRGASKVNLRATPTAEGSEMSQNQNPNERAGQQQQGGQQCGQQGGGQQGGGQKPGQQQQGGGQKPGQGGQQGGQGRQPDQNA